MPCPTCDHSMASINDVAAYRVFLCPRCGTVKTETYTGDPKNWHVAVHTPMLVARCRRLFTNPPDTLPNITRDLLHSRGIVESIYPTESRPIPTTTPKE